MAKIFLILGGDRSLVEMDPHSLGCLVLPWDKVGINQAALENPVCPKLFLQEHSKASREFVFWLPWTAKVIF